MSKINSKTTMHPLRKTAKLASSCFIAILIFSALSMFIATSVQAATLFSDSFQSGSFSAWATSGSPTIVTSPVHGSDRYAAKFTDTGSWTTKEIHKSIGTQSSVSTTIDFQISALPKQGTGLDLLNYKSGSNAVMRVGIYNWNGAFFYMIVGGSETDAKLTISTNTWHSLQVNYDNANNVQSVLFDGNSIITTSARAGSTVNTVYVGALNDMGAVTNVFVDDVTVANNVSPSPTKPQHQPQLQHQQLTQPQQAHQHPKQIQIQRQHHSEIQY